MHDIPPYTPPPKKKLNFQPSTLPVCLGLWGLYTRLSAECMDLLEEMERQQKGLSDENAVLKTENESYLAEIERLAAILTAREQVK